MAEGDLSQIPVGEFETVSQLLASNESIQIAFSIMVLGIIGIAIGYRKFSLWVGSQKFYYQKPHFSRFLRRAVLPVFAIVFITVINVHIQNGILLGDEEALVGICKDSQHIQYFGNWLYNLSSYPNWS
jgi:hypothetical protein